MAYGSRNFSPNWRKQADNLCLLRGMHTDVPAHSQAFLQMHTGMFQFKRPSLGAWAFYGLGTENENLPGFVTISPPLQNGGPSNYGSAFLPAVYQGTPIRTGFGRGAGGPGGRPDGGGGVSNIRNPNQSTDDQRMQLDLIQSLNREAQEREPHNPGIEGAIESFELAFRMQKDLPKVMDVANESAATKATVRHRRPGDRELRPAVPAGPALRRGGRALRRDHLGRVGPPPEPQDRPRHQGPEHRQADRRPAQGPEGARAAARTPW